ncbi:MAG: NAD-dependent epimerase/dehydratase family protein, partial [Proteobacteria bacterium]|nr:NAD-dependent epimerase/dehydratase family protein [Pseudomonadota bacterium]
LNAADGQGLPIYGDGGNVRDWLYVEDHCEGLLLALRKGQAGGKYNIGGGNERTNLEVVDALCAALDEEHLPRGESRFDGPEVGVAQDLDLRAGRDLGWLNCRSRRGTAECFTRRTSRIRCNRE